MRAVVFSIFALVLLAVVFILLNLKPVEVSFFGIVNLRQPLGVVVSLAFLAGALLVYVLTEGASLKRRWRSRASVAATKRAEQASRLYHEGLEALARQETSRARDLLEKALKFDPDHPGVLLVLGNLDREEGRLDEALQRHIRALARSPLNAPILRALAEDYGLAGRVDEALQALDDLLAQMPKDAHALKKKGEVLEAAGRWEKALEVQRSLAKAEGEDGSRLAILRLRAAQASEDRAEARGHLEAALKEDQRLRAAYHLLGELYQEEGNLKEAIKTWKSGWKATKDPALLARIEEACREANQGKKALKILSQAWQDSPQEPLAALICAQTALRLGELKEAEKALASKALEDHPGTLLLKLEAARKRGDEEALKELTLKAVSSFTAHQRPFFCTRCRQAFDEWMPRCSSCQSWDSLKMAWPRGLALSEEPPSAEGQEETETS